MKENHVQTYRIAHVCGTAASIHWESVEKAWIAHRPWPEFDRGFPAFSQIILCRNTLVVKMTAEEPDPCAVFTADNSPVHQDSCLEFFVQPVADCKTYFNFELNPNGCMKAAMGSCRQGRTFLSPPEGYRKFFRVRTMYDPSHWSVCFEIPMELFFGGAAGYPKVMHGNFYKCRGGTSKHYACWNAVDTDAPDFHRPEFFGTLCLL